MVVTSEASVGHAPDGLLRQSQSLATIANQPMSCTPHEERLKT